jgi:uncharacterized protein
MTKILLLSDTHSYLDPRLAVHLDWADELWHGGDWGNHAVLDTLEATGKPLHSVYGNIDGADIRRVFPLITLFNCENLTVGMTHIGGVPGRYKPDALQLFTQGVPDIFVCGHSHILRVQRDPTRHNLLYLNPGAAGKEGFHKIQTALRLKIDDRRIFDVEVIEIGKRGQIPDKLATGQ